VDLAYQDIQALNTEWDFLRTEFSKSMVVGDRTYSLTDLALTDLNAWRITETDEDITIYDDAAADETFLLYKPWDVFKSVFMIGTNRTASGRPTFYSIKPDKSITFNVLPDDAYTFTGEYFKVAQTMAADASEPLIPTQYQMAIVWRAMMFYGAYTGADEAYAHGEKEYRRVLSQLELDQLPRQSFLNGPLI
jgi:hypothetical protein